MSDHDLKIETSSLYWWNFPEMPDFFSKTDRGYTEEVAYYIDTGHTIQESINKGQPRKTTPTMIVTGKLHQ